MEEEIGVNENVGAFEDAVGAVDDIRKGNVLVDFVVDVIVDERLNSEFVLSFVLKAGI